MIVLILKTEQDLSCIETEVRIRYAKMSNKIQRMIALLQAVDIQIKCSDEDIERLVSASDIYYIESVDKKTFVYLEEDVFRTELRLYQIMETLGQAGFVQVSKSCVLNVHMLDYIRPLLNSRMEAVLKNGEKVQINRKYLNDIKQALKGDMGV